MAVVLTDGFDFYGAAQATVRGWTAAFGTQTAGRLDGQAARFSSTGAGALNVRRNLPSTYSTVFYGFALRLAALPAATVDIAAFVASGTFACRIGITSTGLIQIRNSGGTVIATGTTTLVAGTWNYIETKLFVNGASGTAEVHLNGAAGEIASTVGNFGSTNIDQIAIAQLVNNTNTDFDDLYVVDTTGSAPRNTFLGDVRVETVYPTSDGAHTQWPPTGGASHYTEVDESGSPDGDTTYVADGTPGDIDTYGFGDIDGGATVFAVQVNLYARKDDAATRQIAPVVRQAGTDYVGPTATLSTSYLYYSQLYAQDPTATDWIPSVVNANEFGVKEIA